MARRFFPHSVPVLLFFHLLILICLLMYFSQNCILVSHCGVRTVISLLCTHILYNVCIHIHIF